MKINTKIDLPMATTGVFPTENNLIGEYNKINELMYKTNRSNVGQISWESPTSGILYRTVSSEQNPNVYNKGETGLYNLLLGIYGGDNGFILTADDYNKIKDSIIENQTNCTNEINKISNEHNKVVTSIDGRVANINEQNRQANDYLVKINDLATMVSIRQEGELLKTSDSFSSVSFAIPSDADVNNLFVSHFELLYPNEEFWTSGLGTLGYAATIKSDTKKINCYVYFDFSIYSTAQPPQGTMARITYWYRRIGGANNVA